MVAVLFARANSVYKGIHGCDVYDAARNALTWRGGSPVIAHPPCAQWGILKHMARINPAQKKLAPWAVGMVRRWGGVLEHPAGSGLWRACNLPLPGQRDKFGGFTLQAPQFWWGHLAMKDTRFYIKGVSPAQIPPMPLRLGEASHTIGRTRGHRPEVPRSHREKTPEALAFWLVDLATRVQP